MKEDPRYRELMNFALKALSFRAHTTHELHQKLKKRPEYSFERESQVVNRLQELNLLNDERYVQRALEDASQRQFHGPLKAASRLLKKGIPTEQTLKTWKEMHLSEWDLAEAALNRAQARFNSLPKQKAFERRVRFLASRGFSPEIIFELAKKQDNP